MRAKLTIGLKQPKEINPYTKINLAVFVSLPPRAFDATILAAK